MTQKEIVNTSRCSPGTVRLALKRLREHELIVEKLNMRDMRQMLYRSRVLPGVEPRMMAAGPEAGELIAGCRR